METKTKYTLKKKRFIEWVIDDYDDVAYWGNRVREDLINEGECKITLEEMLDDRDCIPSFMLEEYTDDWLDDDDFEEDVDIADVKLID